MPFYTYVCPDCKSEFERFTWNRCIVIHCKSPASQILSVSTDHLKEFQPYWEENMGPEPVYITSRKQRNRELKSRGLAIMDGVHHNSKFKEPKIKRGMWV